MFYANWKTKRASLSKSERIKNEKVKRELAELGLKLYH